MNLFQLTESLSPRLEWMRRNAIQTKQRRDDQWVAWKGHRETRTSAAKFGNGITEDAAIVDLATKLKIRLWNEQTISDPSGSTGHPARAAIGSQGITNIGVVDDAMAAGGDVPAERGEG